MRATSNTLDNNRVQLIVEVDEIELAEAIDATAKQLSREISIKGFRQGKAPRQLIEARIGGPGALRAEAIRASLDTYYARAISETLVDPISQPEVTITGGEESGELTFEAEVEVRPLVILAGQRELRVTIPSPVVTDEELQRQIDRIRETDSELRDVDRPIINGDVLLVDVRGTDPNGEAEPIEVSDYSYTVGTNPIAEGIDETLLGLRAGETAQSMGRLNKGTFLAFELDIKSVRERILPELTDEWVEENTEYETADAMREGVLNQMRRMKLVEAQFARRDAAMMALSDLVDEELAPEALVGAEVEYRIQDLMRRLEQQGINFEYFMEISGQTPESMVALLTEESRRAVRVDLALRALVRAEELQPTDEEIDDELASTAKSMKVTEKVLRENLRDNGRTTAFVAEVGKVKATKWLLENVTYVDENDVEIDRTLLETDQSGEDNAYGEDDE